MVFGFGKKKSAAEFKWKKDGPHAAAHELLDRLVTEFCAQSARYYYDFSLKEFPAGEEILALDRAEQVVVIRAAVERLMHLDGCLVALIEETSKGKADGWIPSSTKEWDDLWDPRSALSGVLRGLLRRKLPFDVEDLIVVMNWVGNAELIEKVFYQFLYINPVGAAIGALERWHDGGALDERLEKAAAGMQALLKKGEENPEARKLGERLNKVLGTKRQFSIWPGEPWADAARASFAEMSDERQEWWLDVVELAHSVSGGKPTKKWLGAAEKLFEVKRARKDFRERVLEWFPLVAKPNPLEGRQRRYEGLEWEINDPNQDSLKGMAWMCGLEEDREVARALGGLTVSAFKKVTGVGARAVRVGNAAVWALGHMPGRMAVGELAVVKARIKQRNLQNAVEKAMDAAAEREGIPRDEIEEMAVPTYGIGEGAVLEVPIGDYRARAVFDGTASTPISWVKADGKVQKSVPAAVKSDHGEALKEVRAAVKDVLKMLPAQRERIDRLYLLQKEWTLEVWLERYINHPLVGIFARRLIWRFKTGRDTVDGVFRDGKIVGRDDQPLDSLRDDTKVQLWHPIDESVDEIVAWREWLEKHEIQQPFKQAHREVYLLTDAERTTRVYSNRYAAHILKQHQFNALCAVKGWRNKLRLMVDDEYQPAHRHLQAWNLRAEFWIEGAGDNYQTDCTDSGTYLYLTTDQVRFYPIDATLPTAHARGGGYELRGAADAIDLEEIPPLVLSEIFRDVDLFVGVASVGNDPTWADGGPDVRYREYWNDFSFGDLSATAKTRKETLERLVPRLKISDRCEISDKFLIVRGDVRTYKIHLGSGNILMEPNDQYLCIVKAAPRPAPGKKGEKIFLPFEGDGVLSVILSKAFLLADDAAIKDKTILSQIRSGS